MKNKCPRGLSGINQPCQLGLLYIESKGKKGCEWGVDDAVSCYCFWKYSVNNPYTHDNKEISRVLGISQSNVRKSYDEAVLKLQGKKDIEHILKILSGDIRRAEPVDISIYDTDDGEEIHMWARHEGASYGMNVEHNNGKPSIYGLSKNWYKSFDRTRTRVTSKNEGKHDSERNRKGN